ncbi:uridine kinase [Oceanobacter mangrovi]|uniref:uridine kinase n=1 Tax=Oceanobacter mangrovi TaxID=2862510 RepID=UPI001C8E73B5|nr:uridine kinase [Oceanobacter mangrovi]
MVLTSAQQAYLNELAGLLIKQLNQCTQPLWIGLAGAPGSGKTTFALALKQVLDQLDGRTADNSRMLVLPMDGYHLYRHQLDAMPDPALAYQRRGAPFTFDARRCVAELIAAKHCGHGSFPGFDHAQGDPLDGQYQLTSQHQLVLVEGNYLLLDQLPWSRLRDQLFDLCWFMDVPPAISNKRVYQRHCQLGLTVAEAGARVTDNDGRNADLIWQQSQQSIDKRIIW